jgi:spore coat protein CotH
MSLSRWTRTLALLALLPACGASDFVPGDDGDGDGDGDGEDDGPADAAPEPEVPPDIDGQLVINEFMTDNALTIRDAEGGAGDWVELHNRSDTDVPLFGYGLTDDLAAPHKTVLRDGLVVPAGGFLILWLDDHQERGPDHVSIKLARDGGAIGLSRPDRSPIDRLTYGAQAVDFSAARTPDGSDEWTIEWHASPGAPNADGGGSPDVRDDADEAPEEVPAAGDLSEEILGDDAMPEIELLIPPASVAALESDPRTYVEAALVYDGREYGPVGLHLKGQNSFLPLSEKAAFRVNVDEYASGAKFFGLDDLTFNNMSTDYSMMHDRVAYWVARQLGLPASRANHALITVNGEFYGLFSNVETIKGRMMERWFDDGGGALFEATDVDFAPAYVDDYEHEDGPDDRSLLQNAADALASGTPAAAIAAASDYIDMVQFQRFWAMCAVIGQFDSFPYSDPGDDYFVYADPVRQRLLVLPWGMDETFYAGDHDVLLVRSILATTCKDAPGCYDAFVDETFAALDATEQMDLVGRLDEIRAQIAPYVSSDTRKPYTDETVTQYQNSMRRFVTDRRTKLETMLAPE